MIERIWAVGVGNWRDCTGRLRFDPIFFNDSDKALAYIEFCREYDQQIGRTRKFKLYSYTI